jgi:hypothetical protein
MKPRSYKGILAKRLPHDPDWATVRTFSNLRVIATLAPHGANVDEQPTVIPPNSFALNFYLDLASRLDALYKFHGVEWGDDDALLFALVIMHVPGLSVEEKHGPKTKWSKRECARLHIAVDEYRATHPRHSISSACKILAREPEWSSMLRAAGTNPGIALRKQYDRAEPRYIADEKRTAAHPEEAAKRQFGRRLLAFEQELNKWIAAHPEQASKQWRSRLSKLSKRLRANKDKQR